MKIYKISQEVEIEANNEEEAWEIFNSHSHDDWEISEQILHIEGELK